MITHGPSRVGSHAIDCGTLPAVVTVAHFSGQRGVEEFHLMVRPTAYGDIHTQLAWTERAYRDALASLGLDSDSAVLRRVFCSDLPNQATALEAHPFTNPHEPDERCAVSWVCQPPMPPAKVALWAYHVRVPDEALDKRTEGASLTLRRGELAHVWTTGMAAQGTSSSEQTAGLLTQYAEELQARGLRVADHVLRTWFFVQNVDVNYQGLVTARREFFTEHGLTPDTHFIASTGIAGASADVAALVTMDAYAIAGVRPEQIHYLAALDHLSPTHVYGVTFERGVAVAYQDRTHVMISGTASIDRAGHIVHPGDVQRQLQHTLKNVDALLGQADATFADVCMFIVYVRDPSDLAVVQQLMEERFGPAPMQVVVAPVCRPGWLIEIECEAIIAAAHPGLPAF
ncbi:MAG TPA: Rid family hydrolase [Armatimonadota bacterium]|jgi:enamine deaminase RidA (YjgF/YER057c/UK114 family)